LRVLYKRIVVPVDFSQVSLDALDYAVEFARAHRSELLILHLIEPIAHTRFIPNVGEILEHQRADAMEKLAGLEKRVRRRFTRFRSEIHFGPADEQIPELAKKARADLIIMATHGHIGFSHFFVGSVAERVVRLANCPVLTVKPKELGSETKVKESPSGKRIRTKRRIVGSTE
jgi:nucleotide-binding universal stress UspA family protein